MDLHSYDIIIINSSAGKDSLCAIHEICKLADEQSYSRNKIFISHQDLGFMEWPGTKELAVQQAKMFGLSLHISHRLTKAGVAESLLEYVRRRKKWPANKQRYCTSDFKRGPGEKLLKALAREQAAKTVLNVFGFRKDESPARSKKKIIAFNKRASCRTRKVDDFLPIHNWSSFDVWSTIKQNNLPYHYAYDLGMPRLSCCFCIFSPFDALVTSGYANPKLLNEYVEVEKEIGHTFRKELAIVEIQKAIENKYQPKKIADWVM
jgi:3'-phosphoadenosine 5'-phosphosulfate sulfotransferase (PAPS reductase)/FAD synthetase